MHWSLLDSFVVCPLLHIYENDCSNEVENCGGCWPRWTSAQFNLSDGRAAKIERGTKPGEANFNFHIPCKSELNLVGCSG